MYYSTFNRLKKWYTIPETAAIFLDVIGMRASTRTVIRSILNKIGTPRKVTSLLLGDDANCTVMYTPGTTILDRKDYIDGPEKRVARCRAIRFKFVKSGVPVVISHAELMSTCIVEDSGDDSGDNPYPPEYVMKKLN